MKAVVAAFNQEKALVGAFSVLANLRMELLQALTPALSSSLQWENVLELRTNKQNVLTLIHMIQGGQCLLLSCCVAHSSYVVNMEN